MQQERTGKERDVQYQNLLCLIGEHRGDPGNTGPSLRAGQMRPIANSYRLAEAYKEESRVAYAPEQFPTEILFVFDVLPELMQ